VVAIIAMLMSILLPSLKCAREAARAAACGSLLRSFGTGLSSYVTEYDGIPGVNTTGVPLRQLMGGNWSDWQRGNLPVQQYDWMSPILKYDTEFPNSRAERWALLQERYRCPSQVGYSSLIYQRPPDWQEFQTINQELTALSYLMPMWFQWWGSQQTGYRLGDIRGGLAVYAQVGPTNFEVKVKNFRSRLEDVGNPARKVFAADGTRFMDVDRTVDHDVNPFPQWFGSFTSTGAWWAGSTAYGVKRGSLNWADSSVGRGSPAEGENLTLSYRHGCQRGAGLSGTAQANQGAINAVFFDGHVDRLRDRPSREIHLWYPQGAVVNTSSEGMTAAAIGDIIP